MTDLFLARQAFEFRVVRLWRGFEVLQIVINRRSEVFGDGPGIYVQ